MKRLLLVAISALVVTGAALADPLDPKVKYNNADQARASAAVLVQSDLGMAWRGGPTTAPRSLKAPICPSLRPDYSKMTLTGHAESLFDNGNGGVQVVADVEVWQTLKQAEQHMNALLTPKLAGTSSALGGVQLSPLVTGQSGSEDPYDAYARQESLSMAYILLLQKLSLVERAVFLLREVFGQLTSDAQRHLATAFTLLENVPPEVKPVFLPLALVSRDLKRMSRADFDPFVPQPSSRLRILWTLWRASRSRLFS